MHGVRQLLTEASATINLSWRYDLVSSKEIIHTLKQMVTGSSHFPLRKAAQYALDMLSIPEFIEQTNLNLGLKFCHFLHSLQPVDLMVDLGADLAVWESIER